MMNRKMDVQTAQKRRVSGGYVQRTNYGNTSQGRNGQPQPRRSAQGGARRPQAGMRFSKRRQGRSWLAVCDHRLSLVCGLLVALLVVYTGMVLRANTTLHVDFSVIRQRMAAVVTAKEPADANAMKKAIGVEDYGLQGWLYYPQDSTMDVSELLILMSTDTAVLDAAENAVNEHLAAQIISFENYGTNQSFLLKNAIVWRQGSYLFYGVGEEVDRWQEAFLSCVR